MSRSSTFLMNHFINLWLHIVCREGSDLIEADALSQLSRKLVDREETLKFFAPRINLPITCKAIRKAIRNDPMISKVLDLTRDVCPTKIYSDENMLPYLCQEQKGNFDWGELPTLGKWTVIIPEKLRNIVKFTEWNPWQEVLFAGQKLMGKLKI